MRLALSVGYLGDRFYGSQVQPDVRTVEGVFIETCIQLGLFDDPREAGFLAAGRTDRGVHSRSNVFSFDTAHPQRAIEVLNMKLPADIWCNGYAFVEEGFNPRHRALTRTYRYFFPDERLDINTMRLASGKFLGEHDFTMFSRTSERSTIREILGTSLFREKDFIVFEVTGKSFLWNMVRRMATVLYDIGIGECNAGIIDLLLSGDAIARPATAPPEGLVLWNIEYPFVFTAMEKGGKSLRYRQNASRRFHVLKKVYDSV
jgi:tRNA pseudouridine38-40 synthase